MDTERYKALMDAAKILLDALDDASGRGALLVLDHAISHVVEEMDVAEEVSA